MLVSESKEVHNSALNSMVDTSVFVVGSNLDFEDVALMDNSDIQVAVVDNLDFAVVDFHLDSNYLHCNPVRSNLFRYQARNILVYHCRQDERKRYHAIWKILCQDHTRT